MNDIKVSVYGACNRPRLWNWFYDTLSMNKINFEIIFVGNVRPDFELPKNFKFIYSNVKPSQCTHIAAANCSGEVIQHVADDCENVPYGLDALYNLYKQQNDYKCIVAPRFYNTSPLLGGIDMTHTTMRLVDGDPSSLPLHVGGIMSKQFYDELGGLDSRFIFSFADLDLQVRAQMQYGRILYHDSNVWMAERKDLTPGDDGKRSAGYSGGDHGLLRYLWFEGTRFKTIRTDAVQKYINNDDLLQISYPPKGEWS